MTKDELILTIHKYRNNEISGYKMADTVQEYTDAILKQCNVSGSLPLHEYIKCMNKHMAEMYIRHDYRSMYEIWKKVSELAKLTLTAHN